MFTYEPPLPDKDNKDSTIQKGKIIPWGPLIASRDPEEEWVAPADGPSPRTLTSLY